MLVREDFSGGRRGKNSYFVLDILWLEHDGKQGVFLFDLGNCLSNQKQIRGQVN
jgi:hypothetical protein